MSTLRSRHLAWLNNINVVGTLSYLGEKTKVTKDGGSIANTGSFACAYGPQGVPANVAAKRALIGLTKVAAFEGALGVHVSAFNPYVWCGSPGGCANDCQQEALQYRNDVQAAIHFTNRRISPARFHASRSVASLKRSQHLSTFLLDDESAHVLRSSCFVDGVWAKSNFSSG